MTYKRLKQSPHGGWLRCHLPQLATDALVAKFGARDTGTCYEPERGYNGDEFSFKAPDGATFTVYARWGDYRIGSAASGEAVARFAEWFTGEMGVQRV